LFQSVPGIRPSITLVTISQVEALIVDVTVRTLGSAG
jgi:hypothetical protein